MPGVPPSYTGYCTLRGLRGTREWFPVQYQVPVPVQCTLLPGPLGVPIPGTTGRLRCLVPGPSMFYDEPMHVAMIGVLVPVV